MKNLVMGLLVGILLMVLVGAYSPSNESDFGFGVPNNGYAVIADKSGCLYIVNSEGVTIKAGSRLQPVSEIHIK
jgi:hypothetical protein